MTSVQNGVQRLGIVAAATVFVGGAVHVSALSIGDGLVFDGPSSTVYIMSPKGVEARNLADGELRWHSVDAQRPLAVADGRLLAQGASRASGSLPLMLLDGNTGGAEHTFSAALPDAVRATVDERLGERFAVAMEDGALVWRYSSRSVQGIPPQENDPRRASFNGMIGVDMAAGAARAMDQAAPAQRLVDVQLRTPLVNEAGRQFYSADRQHVLVSSRLEAGDVQRRYRWTLYNLERKRLGAFDASVSYSPFVVSGGRVLLVTPPISQRKAEGEQQVPLSVLAVSLASGEEVWRAPLRDTRYRGPIPP